MSRKLIITQIVIWSVVAVLLLGVLAAGAQGGGAPFAFRFNAGGPLRAVHEQTLPLDGIGAIALNFPGADVTFLPADGGGLRVVQYVWPDLPAEQYFTASAAGGSLTVTQPRTMPWWGLFGSMRWQRVEVYLPASYAGELTLTASSGDVTLPDALSLSQITLNLSSGDLNGGDIRAARADIHTSSGDLRFGNLVCDSYKVSSSSGDMELGSVEGSGKISASSGEIRIDALAGRAEVSSASGDIRVGSFSGEGGVSAASGTVSVGFAALTGDTELRSTSGNVIVTLPKGTAVSVEANCVSGDVESEYPLTFTGERHSAYGDTAPNPAVRLKLSTVSGDVSLRAG